MEDFAIRVDDVTKVYKLYDKPSDRLKEALKLTRKKKYREHYALNNVSFNIERGKTVGIIGTNGSGKSTILKIITGVLNPTGGHVYVNGRISALLELGAGFNQEYTGIENIYLNGTMIGFSKEEIDAKLPGILEFADIGDFVNQPVKTYSSGMFVRLAFAVAINIEPEILIVDEALSVGDVFFQAKCYKKFEEFREAGKTIVIVSHDLGSIAKYCDSVVLLNKGNKILQAEPKEAIDVYKKILVNQFDEDEEVTVEKLNESVGKLEVNPNVIEYGEKEGEITGFSIIDNTGMITNTIEKGTEFTISMKVKFKERVDSPIFAFTVRDTKGTEITGTNTLFEKADVGVIEAGTTKDISFTQKMSLQGGSYLMSLGCTGYRGDDFVVYHRLYDACNIQVISYKDTVGFYDMDSKVHVE